MRQSSPLNNQINSSNNQGSGKDIIEDAGDNEMNTSWHSDDAHPDKGAAVGSLSKKRSVDGGMKNECLHSTSEKAADISTSLILQDDEDDFATSPSGRQHSSSSSIHRRTKTSVPLQVDTTNIVRDHDVEFDNGTGSGSGIGSGSVIINNSEPSSPFSPSQQSSSSSQYHHQYVGRMYNVLFDSVNRAVDDLYRLCEEQGDEIMCEESACLFQRTSRDFTKLIERMANQVTVTRPLSHPHSLHHTLPLAPSHPPSFLPSLTPSFLPSLSINTLLPLTLLMYRRLHHD